MAIGPDFGDFVERAEAFLSAWELDYAIRHINPDKLMWHPTGFMALHTTARFEGMPVRMHFWPRGNRPIDPAHPPIHNHVWPLAGLVVTGTYSEAIYQLEESETGPLACYKVNYHSRDDSTVRADALRYRVDQRDFYSYQAGEIHSVAAGTWHETVISSSDRVITVMVTGQQRLAAPHLVGPPGFVSGRRTRLQVTRNSFVEQFGDLIQ